MYIGLHVKYPFFFCMEIQLEFSPYIFEKYSMKKVTVAFCNYTNVPKIAYYNYPLLKNTQ
jgi:hypothetical protein